MESISLLSILSIAALGLLILVSGGVLYLTTLDWQERRLQEEEKRQKRGR